MATGKTHWTTSIGQATGHPAAFVIVIFYTAACLRRRDFRDAVLLAMKSDLSKLSGHVGREPGPRGSHPDYASTRSVHTLRLTQINSHCGGIAIFSNGQILA
jgi:hypothetical protein